MDFIDTDGNGFVDIVELENYIRGSRRKVKGVIPIQNKTIVHFSKSAPKLPSMTKTKSMTRTKKNRKRAKLDANGEITELSPLARTVLLHVDKTLRSTSMRALDLFNSIDTSGNRGQPDSQVDVDEFSNGIKKVGLKMKMEQVVSIFDELDANGDRTLDILEFDKALRLARRLKASGDLDFWTLEDYGIKEIKVADLDESLDFNSPSKKHKCSNHKRRYNLPYELMIDFILKSLKKDDFTSEAAKLKELMLPPSDDKKPSKRLSICVVDVHKALGFSFKDLANLLKALGFNMTKRELAAIKEEISSEDDEKNVDLQKLRSCINDRLAPRTKDVDDLKDHTSHNHESDSKQESDSAEQDLQRKKLVANVLLYIDKTLRKRNWQLKDLFNKIDSDKGNDVDLKEFTQALDYIGLQMDTEQVNSVFKTLDVNGDKTLDLGEFDKHMRMTRRLRATGHDFGSLKGCGVTIYKGALRSNEKRDNPREPPNSLKKLLGFMNLNSMRTTELFRRMNLKSVQKNEVTKQSFEEGLLNFRLGFSSSDLEEIFKIIDQNGDGNIHMRECQLVLQGYLKMYPGNKHANQKAREGTSIEQKLPIPDQLFENFKKLDATMRRKGMRTRDFFASIDKDASGGITLDEFEAALMDSKIFLKKSEVVALFQFMDGNGNGDITLEEMDAILRNFKRGHFVNASAISENKAEEAMEDLPSSLSGLYGSPKTK
jgi:Ca2+-binding EF-hand superfamily protein